MIDHGIGRRKCSFCRMDGRLIASVAKCTFEAPWYVCDRHLIPAAGCGFCPQLPSGYVVTAQEAAARVSRREDRANEHE